jgi:hypothetical protein
MIGHRQNFGCPSGPSGQNSIFPMRDGGRDDGIYILRSHQYSLSDESVTEEIKRQTFSKHSWLSGMSGLSALLRKTAFRLILIGDSYSDTSVCPSQGD